MTALTDQRVYRTTEVARVLGVSYRIVNKLAARWYRPGSGYHVGLTDTDVMVCRALIEINARRSLCPSHATGRLLDLAETTIRTDPRRWLLMVDPRAQTFDSAEEAGDAWWTWPRPRGAWLIDLRPEKDAA